MISIKTESAWRGTADCRACGVFVREGAVQVMDNQGRIHRVVDVDLLNAPKA